MQTVSVWPEAESARLPGIRYQSRADTCADVADAPAAHSCAASVVDIPASKSLGTLCFSSVSATRRVDNRDPERRKMLCFRRVSVGDRLRVRLAWCGFPGVARVSRENSGRRAF